MATRKAQVIIDVDSKSLSELNAEIQALQSEIDDLKVGTEEWIKANEKLGDLKRKFQVSTDEATKLQGQIEKISSPQQIQAFAKLGNGLVGAFAGVSGTIDLLGIQSEELDKITAKATALTSIMGGLNAVADAFSKESITGLKAIGSGFGKLVTTVKTASTAMKAALVATGIGALAVAVGLLISNWEKVTSLLNGSARANQKLREESEGLVEGFSTQNEILNKQLEILAEIRNYQGEFYDAGGLVEQNIQNQNASLRVQIALNKDLIALGKKGDVGSQAAIDKAEKYLRAVQQRAKLEEKSNGFVSEKVKNELLLANVAVLQAKQNRDNVEFETQALELQLKLNEQILDQRKRASEENAKAIKDSELAVGIAESELLILRDRESRSTSINELQTNSLKIYQKELEIIDEQVKQIKILEESGAKLTDDEQLRLIALYDQQTVLAEQYAKRFEDLQQLGEQLLFLEKQRDLNEDISEELSNISSTYAEIQTTLNAITKDYELNSSRIEFQNSLLENEKDVYEDLVEEVRYKDSIMSRQAVTAEKLAEITEKELEFYVKAKEFQNEELRNNINILGIRRESVLLRQEEIDATIGNLQRSKESLQNEIDRNAELFKQAESDQERVEINQRTADLKAEQRDLDQEIADLKGEQLENSKEIQSIDFEIAKSTEEIANNQSDITRETRQTTEELERQEKIYAKLQNFTERYAAEIQAVQDVLRNSFEALASLQDRKIEVANQQLDKLNKELSVLEGKYNGLYDDRLALEEELKDANGERYDELLARINQAKDAETEAKDEIQIKNDEIKKQENARQLAEYNAAKWRKAQAIVDAVIQTALAVIKALPNVFLSIATGVAGAAATASIAAQKLPAKPEGFAQGGFTGIGDANDVAGVVHKGEYVVPASVVKSPSAKTHITALENKRVRGYQNGGPVVSQFESNIDYQKFADILTQAVSSLPNPQVSLVSISNGIREVELTKQNSGFNR